MARQRPLLLVMGGQVVENTSPATTPGQPLHETRSAGGLIILSKANVTGKPRIVGHPELATQTRYRRGDTLYVSISEALWLESQGEDVELHFEPNQADSTALAEVKQKVRRRWDNDRLPDGWTRRRDEPSGNRLSQKLPGRGINPENQSQSGEGQPYARTSLTESHGQPDENAPSSRADWDTIREQLIRQRLTRLRRPLDSGPDR